MRQVGDVEAERWPRLFALHEALNLESEPNWQVIRSEAGAEPILDADQDRPLVNQLKIIKAPEQAWNGSSKAKCSSSLHQCVGCDQLHSLQNLYS